jgi:hypothetical protein
MSLHPSLLARSGTLNRGSTLPARKYLRNVFLDRPMRREISRIAKWSRWPQSRMTLNNSMLISPFTPALVAGQRFQHGSNLDGKT